MEKIHGYGNLTNIMNHACRKLTLSHFVPLVNVLKEAVPSSIPEGVPRSAIQFTIEDPFLPRPDSNKHTRKLLCVTSDVHTTAESWTLRDSLPWLIEARTRIFSELENARVYCTVVQHSKSGYAIVKLTFPFWTSTSPKHEMKSAFIRNIAIALKVVSGTGKNH